MTAIAAISNGETGLSARTKVNAALSMVNSIGAVVNVQHPTYGAVGDGVADDSAAIQAAVNAAVSVVRLAVAYVYFPVGIYKITQDGVLTQTTIDHSAGVKYIGDGRAASVLRLATTSTDLYFYNPGSTPRMQNCSFEDIGFQGMDPAAFSTYADIPDHAKGFRLWATSATGSHEQNFKFIRCIFSYLNIIFDMEGDQTASENSWLQCEFVTIKNNVLNINNVQSFNHEFHACNFTSIFGDCFYIPAGGGAIRVFGGSAILDGAKGTDTYFLRITSSIGMGADPYMFYGQRMELRGNTTKLLYIADTTQSNVVFADTLFEDQATVAKTDWCRVSSYNTVEFRGCSFYEFNGVQIEFSVNGAWGYGEDGAIIFQSCALSTDWSDRCSVVNGVGRITARDCFGTNVGVLYNATPNHYAHDFDLYWDEATPGQSGGWTSSPTGTGGSLTNNNRRLKTAAFLTAAYGWPNDGFEHTLKMPRNAIIKSIYMRKPPGGSQTTTGTYNVGKNDKSVSHLASASAAYNAGHTGDLEKFFYHVGTTTNERQLRLWFGASVTGGNPGGGFVFVEYY